MKLTELSVKEWFNILLLSLLLTPDIFAQTDTLIATSEAENGILAGVTVSTALPGYSGTGYVTGFDNTGDKITVPINITKSGFYKLVVRYSAPNGTKTEDIFINSTGPYQVTLSNTSVFSDAEAGKYFFSDGANTITLQKNWGWTNIDKFSLYTVIKNVYTINSDLVNPNADSITKSLYNFFRYNFNSKIISGQTDGYYEGIKTLTGKSPMLRTFDFQHYSQGYSYLWDNSTGGFKFGWEDNGVVQKAINWYKSTGGRGIVGFHWHWHSPSGGTVGTNTFYTTNTTFDVSKAVIPGTQENKDVIRDIDSIATQLKKIQNAGVPLLWRPLHEAGGGWFWWGAKGSAACKNLYHIMYNRLTNYHGLHNLIWTWSSPEADWYPGNDSIDIVGHDSYPGAYNYNAKKNDFDILYKLVNGKKIIALTENGPIPNPNECFAADAPWSYFMSWSPNVTSENTSQHIKEVFNNPIVLVLEPSKPQIPSGATELYKNPENQIYTTRKISEATSYLWKVTPTNAAIVTGSDTVATLDFDSTFVGKVKLNVTAKNSFGLGITSDTLVINVLQPVKNNIKAIDKQNFASISPSPLHGIFEININHEIGIFSLEIFDISGNLVYMQNNIAQNSFRLDISNLAEGLYILKINSGSMQINKKLMLIR